MTATNPSATDPGVAAEDAGHLLPIPPGKLDEDWSTPYYIFRRVLDIAFSLLMLLLFMPLVATLGLITRLEDGGPMFYRGRRVGKDGKVFNMYKLRTLKVDVESQIGATLLQETSNHFTRMGRVIRRTKLDEIPQFYNVLRGDMAVIGPRPVRPIRGRLFMKTIPGFRQILQVKPGISGLSQVMADYYDPAERKFEYDLDYIRRRSLWFDTKLVFLTGVRVPIAAVQYVIGLITGTPPKLTSEVVTGTTARGRGPSSGSPRSGR